MSFKFTKIKVFEINDPRVKHIKLRVAYLKLLNLAQNFMQIFSIGCRNTIRRRQLNFSLYGHSGELFRIGRSSKQ